VWKVLRRHGISTRAKRLGLIAGYRAPYEPPREPAAAGWQLGHQVREAVRDRRSALLAGLLSGDAACALPHEVTAWLRQRRRYLARQSRRRPRDDVPVEGERRRFGPSQPLGGPAEDFNLPRALRLAEDARACGLETCVVLHYSDTWADRDASESQEAGPICPGTRCKRVCARTPGT
jgi:hypothetical protein